MEGKNPSGIQYYWVRKRNKFKPARLFLLRHVSYPSTDESPLLSDLQRGPQGPRDCSLRTQLLHAVHPELLGPGQEGKLSLPLPRVRSYVSHHASADQEHNSGAAGERHGKVWQWHWEDEAAAAVWRVPARSEETPEIYGDRNRKRVVFKTQKPPGCLLLHRRADYLCGLCIGWAWRTQDWLCGRGTEEEAGTLNKQGETVMSDLFFFFLKKWVT